MANEILDKKNLFYILKALANNGTKKANILNYLNINESTFYRHLNLIKEAGFKIKKEGDTYSLMNYKNLFNFSQQELNTFVYLLLFAYAMLPTKKVKLFLNAVEKMLTISTQKDAYEVEQKYEMHKVSAITECYSKKITQLNKYLNTKKKITIILKNAKELKINPLDFKWVKDKLHLKYIDENDIIASVSLDSIVKIEGIKKSFNLKSSQEVIFELYGKLSKSYLLKEEERIIHYSKDKLVIANCTKDKTKLFRRLLRYDVLCKVTFPKKDVLEFKKMIEKTLDNIAKVSDNIEL